MAKNKNEEFTTKSFENMMNFGDSTNKALNEIRNLLKDTFKNSYNGSEDEVKIKLESSEELRKNLNELNNLFEKELELAQRNKESIDKLSEKYGVSADEIEKALKIALKKDEINTRILEKKKELNKYKKGGKRYKEVEKELNSLQITDSIISEKMGKNHLSNDLYRNIKTKDLKEIKSIESDILNLQTEINDKSKEFTEVSNENAKALNKVEKKITAVCNITKGLIEIIKVSANKWLEIDDNVFKTGRSIGLATSQIRGYQKNILDNYSDMAAKLGMTFEEMFKFQENYAKNTGRAIVLTNEEVTSLAGISKLNNDNGASANEMVKSMDDLGASTKTASDYLALNRARAQASGLEAAKSSEIFAKNVKLASKYNFREGVNGISKMTLLSQKLKFNMDSIASAADKFETIEGAISTSANLQMLGGTFANQFGNPLEAMNMAILDMEGFTNKIIDTFSGKALFNRETGQVEMSAIDKRFLKEAAKQLGISYEDAWNIAAQKAKISDIERQLNPSQNFSELDKAYISANAKFNSETGNHEITYFDENGNQQTIEASKIDKKLLNSIKGQELSEEQIRGDVKGIHILLDNYINKQVRDTKSGIETKNGLKESYEIAGADFIDTPMDFLKNIGNSFSNVANVGEKTLGLMVLYKMASSVFQASFSKKVNDFFKGKAIKLFSHGSSVNNATSAAAASGTNLNGARGWLGGSKNFLNKIPKKKLMKYGKYGLLTAGALSLASSLMSFSSGSESNSIVNGNHPNENNSFTLNENSDELEELKKQTEILSSISNLEGKNVTYSNSKSKYNNIKYEIENGMVNSNSVVDTGLLLSSFFRKTGPYSQVAMGIYDLANAKSTYKEQVDKINNSNLSEKEKNKLIKNASSKKDERYGKAIGGVAGASLGLKVGAMIGSAIPIPVVGTLLGSALGYYVGDKIGGYVGKNINKEDKTYNNPTNGLVNGTYDNINKLDTNCGIAICKSHDLLSSINDKIITRKDMVGILSYDMTSIKSNSVLSLPTVGSSTYIKEEINRNKNTLNNNYKSNDINLNIKGTIKLESDKGSKNIDINKLLNDPVFIDKLISIVKEETIKKSNGQRIDKSTLYSSTSSFDMNGLNGIPKMI